MQALLRMDVNTMVIVLPTALVAMYVIVSLQKSLSAKENPYLGLLMPALCFVAAAVLALRPLFVAEPGEYEGLAAFCLRMWLTFNIPTIVLLFPYIRERRIRKALREAEEAEAASH